MYYFGPSVHVKKQPLLLRSHPTDCKEENMSVLKSLLAGGVELNPVSSVVSCLCGNGAFILAPVLTSEPFRLRTVGRSKLRAWLNKHLASPSSPPPHRNKTQTCPLQQVQGFGCVCIWRVEEVAYCLWYDEDPGSGLSIPNQTEAIMFDCLFRSIPISKEGAGYIIWLVLNNGAGECWQDE